MAVYLICPICVLKFEVLVLCLYCTFTFIVDKFTLLTTGLCFHSPVQ